MRHRERRRFRRREGRSCRSRRTRPSSDAGLTNSGAPDFNPDVIDTLAAPDIRFEYSLHAPCRGREEVRAFATKFRAAFPDLAFGATADLIAEGDYVVGQWVGGGTQTGEAFDDLPIGALPAGTDKTMRFTGTSVLRIVDGLILVEAGVTGCSSSVLSRRRTDADRSSLT